MKDQVTIIIYFWQETHPYEIVGYLIAGPIFGLATAAALSRDMNFLATMQYMDRAAADGRIASLKERKSSR